MTVTRDRGQVIGRTGDLEKQHVGIPAGVSMHDRRNCVDSLTVFLSPGPHEFLSIAFTTDERHFHQ